MMNIIHSRGVSFRRRILFSLCLICVLLFFVTVATGTAYDDQIAAIDRTTDLQEAANLLSNAETLDEQIAMLHELSKVYSEMLENGGWDVDLSHIRAKSPAEELIPDLDNTDNIIIPEDIFALFEDRKIISLYSDGGDINLLGDFYARLPENMQAGSLQEADTILYLRHYLIARTDYIGSASNRFYEIYLIDRNDQKVYQLYETYTTPPLSGTGHLTGDIIPLESLWRFIRKHVYGTITIEYPEGTAEFRITGKTCSICALNGDFINYEIPAEVQGYPVKAIDLIRNETVESLTLPEGIETITSVVCQNLTKINFPSTLKSIGSHAFYMSGQGGFNYSNITEWNLNEGLEEIGDGALRARECTISLPSTLEYTGDYFLNNGVKNSYLIFPEGFKGLREFSLYHTGHLICVYFPASVIYIEGNCLASGKNIRLYAPEGSYAARWAKQKGCDYVPCDDPESMPRPYYITDENYEYAVVENEVFIYRYLGNEACVTVPETLSGLPVTTLMEEAFCYNESLRLLVLPDSVEKVNHNFVFSCDNLEALFIPGTTKASELTNHANDLISCRNPVTVYTTEDALCKQRYRYNVIWAEWTPGLEKELISRIESDSAGNE